MKKKKTTISELAESILSRAKELELDNNPYFLNIYHLLSVQLEMLLELETSFKESGVLVSKTYVKGRENIYCNPAIERYTKVSDSATNKIMKLKEILSDNGNEIDYMEDFINDDLE